MLMKIQMNIYQLINMMWYWPWFSNIHAALRESDEKQKSL